MWKRFCLFFSVALVCFPQARPRIGVTDLWTRQKECAEQASKLESAKLKTGSVESWSNHYSPKYGRCFIAITTDFKLLEVGISLTIVEEAGTTFPRYETRLLDAFENRLVAMTTWDGPAGDCLADHKRVGCVLAKQFITDHMEH